MGPTSKGRGRGDGKRERRRERRKWKGRVGWRWERGKGKRKGRRGEDKVGLEKVKEGREGSILDDPGYDPAYL